MNTTTQSDFRGTATYSPEDNKLRFTPFHRLVEADYNKVRAHGFIWAPKQRIFVAPMWTPDREDLLIEWCGEIGDEDTSLTERAEVRSERFEEYSDKRLTDANEARDAVGRIADGIPMGQPILIGHHSQKRAERDQEKMDSGMRRAVKMWETSKYWQRRAEGAIAHAKYKELPAVRARRIKGIEADLRKRQKQLGEATEAHVFWVKPDLTKEEAIKFTGGHNPSGFNLPKREGDFRPTALHGPSDYDALTNQWPASYAPRTFEDVVEQAAKVYPGRIAYLTRWIMHYENRLAYEKAMLNEQGASDLIAPKARPTQLPLLNYRSPTIRIEHRYNRGTFVDYPQVEMTKADFAAIYGDYRGTREVDGTHRVRFAIVNLSEYPQFRKPDDVERYRRTVDVVVFLTDSKAHKKPGAEVVG